MQIVIRALFLGTMSPVPLFDQAKLTVEMAQALAQALHSNDVTALNAITLAPKAILLDEVIFIRFR